MMKELIGNALEKTKVDSLDHSLVKDYRDFETVASQLMLPINAV
jgi:hypothetical protein